MENIHPPTANNNLIKRDEIIVRLTILTFITSALMMAGSEPEKSVVVPTKILPLLAISAVTLEFGLKGHLPTPWSFSMTVKFSI